LTGGGGVETNWHIAHLRKRTERSAFRRVARPPARRALKNFAVNKDKRWTLVAAHASDTRTMAFALRAVNSIATAAPLRSVARRSARAPAARVAVRAMADEAPEAPEGVEQLIDARVGKVIKAYKHSEADKLYVEEVDVGEAEPRQICSGLVPYMNAEVRAAHSAPDPRVARVAPRHPRPSRLIATVHTEYHPHRSPETCISPPPRNARA